MAEANDKMHHILAVKSPEIDRAVPQSSFEQFATPGVDRRTPVKNLLAAEVYSGMVKLLVTFLVDGKLKEFHGSGQIVNLNLGDGSVSKCYIQTAAHNFIIEDQINKTRIWFSTCTAYLRMSGQSKYDHKIPVMKAKAKVYDKYFTAKDSMGFDFAIAPIDISPDKVSINTWDSKFNTLPAIASKLKIGHEILIAGYPGETPKSYQAHEMKGKIDGIRMTDEHHGVIYYKDLDTSRGQSGSMVLLTEEPSKVRSIIDHDIESGNVKTFPVGTRDIRLCATNIAVHKGGDAAGNNFATIITPTIMEWVRDQVINGELWEGGYRHDSSDVNAIGAEGIILEEKVGSAMKTREVKETYENFNGGVATLYSDGTVVCSGNPLFGGDAGEKQALLTNVKSICSTYWAFSALKENGSVVSWGHADYGGENEMSLTNVKSIFSTDWAFVALLENGSVKAWGHGDYGGNVDALTNVKSIFSTGGAFVALLENGIVFAWGDADEGGGIGKIQALLTNVKSISSTYVAFAALKENGSVLAWGDARGGGELGPEKQILLIDVKSIFSTKRSFCALLENGSVLAWGDAEYGGELGDKKVLLTEVKSIFSTERAFVALLEDRSMVAWGHPEWGGELGEEQQKLDDVVCIAGSDKAFAARRDNGEDIVWGDKDHHAKALRNLRSIIKRRTTAIRQLVERSILANDEERYKEYLRKIFDNLEIVNAPKGTRKKLKKKIDHCRETSWRKAESVVWEERSIQIKKLAEEKIYRQRKILDQSDELKRAVIFDRTYSGDGSRYEEVKKMSNERMRAILLSYSHEILDQAIKSQQDLLDQWRHPDLLEKFIGLERKNINIVVCGKSGHGKSSLINCIGKHFGIDFRATTDVTECTKECRKYQLCPGVDLWDIAGYGTKSFAEGNQGRAYIRDFCLTYFNIVLLVMAERETEFAAISYKNLIARGKEIYVVRTKMDYDLESKLELDRKATRDEVMEEIRNNVKKEIGAKPENIFLTASVPDYFDTQNLCRSILDFVIARTARSCISLSENEICEIEKLCAAGVDSGSLMRRFDIKPDQMIMIRRVVNMKKVLKAYVSRHDYGKAQPKFQDSKFAQDDSFGFSDSESNDVENQNVKAIEEVVPICEEDQMVMQIQIRLQSLTQHPDEDSMKDLNNYENSIDMSSFKSRREDVGDIFERFRQKIQRYIDNKEAQVTQELEEELNIDASKFEGILTEAQKKVKEEIMEKVETQMLEEEIMRQEKEDLRLKWILNKNMIVKRAFLFTLQYNSDSDEIETVKRINDGDINRHLRIAFRAKMECKKTQQQITDELKLNRTVNAEDYMRYFQSKEEVICKYWRFPPPLKLNEWNQWKRIGVVGSSGTGKSAIIRSLLSVLGDGDYNSYKGKPLKEIDIKIDVKEATLEVSEYNLTSNVKLVDFPGAETPTNPKGLKGIDYIRKFNILYYSVIIIATCGRFDELDLELANICYRNKVKFIFVRTKFDRDVQEEYRNTEEEIDDFPLFIRQIQRRLKSKLDGLFEGFKMPLYCINGLRVSDYSFPQLLKNINHIVKSSDELQDFQLPHLDFSEELFFDLLANNGDIFQNAVDELRELEAEVADLVSFTNADILTLDCIDCDESSDLIRKQIETLAKRHRKNLITLKDTYIQNPPEEELRIKGKHTKKAIKSIFDGIVCGKWTYNDRIINIIFEFIAAFEIVRRWSPQQVGERIAEFGSSFKCCVAPLSMSGELLLKASNDSLFNIIGKANVNVIKRLAGILYL